MSIHSKNTLNFTRHVGTYGDKRIVIVIQTPDDPYNVHVIDTEALPDIYSQNLMDILLTPEAQNSPWLGEVLHRKMLFDGTNALKAFYEKNWIQIVPTNRVNLVPRPNMVTPLSEALGQYQQPFEDDLLPNVQQVPINDPLAEIRNPQSLQEQTMEDIVRQEQAKLNAFDTSTQRHNQHAENLTSDINEQSKLTAANLITEAKMLENEANAKRSLAAQYDPSVAAQPDVSIPQTFTDPLTGKTYASEAALKGVITRRNNAAKQ